MLHASVQGLHNQYAMPCKACILPPPCEDACHARLPHQQRNVMRTACHEMHVNRMP
jgi:hypothetical protein